MAEPKSDPETAQDTAADGGDRSRPDDRSAADVVEKDGSGEPAKKPPAPDPQDDTSPAAGPHADPDLTNDEATPGSGTLSPPGAADGTDSTSS
jgi:hypothetical protein